MPTSIPVVAGNQILASDYNNLRLDVLSALEASGILLPASPAADHLAYGLKIQLAAAVNMAFGDVGHIAAAGNVDLGKADAIATSNVLLMVADATIAAAGTGNFVLGPAIVRHDAWAWGTVGGLIYLSITGTTTNTLTQTAPSGTDQVIQIVGVALSATKMIFAPQLVQIEHT